MQRSVSPVPILVSLLVCGLLLPPSLHAGGTPWPAFRGADGTGSASGVLPAGEGPLTFELIWQRDLGSGYSGVTVTDGALFTAAFGQETDHVVALDPATGEELWRAELGPSYAGHDGSHDGPIATPAVADGRVFMLGPHGELKAYDAGDGSVTWESHLVEDHGSEKPFYGFGSSPRVVDGKVILQIGGEDGSVAAFDAATGELAWRAVDDEIATQTPVLAELREREQIVVIGAKKVVGLDPDDGEILWSLEHHGERGGMGAYTSSPLPVSGNHVFLKHGNAASGVLALTAEDGEPTPVLVHQTKGMGRSYSPPSLWNDTVYGYTARFLSAADSVTGELLWRSREPGDGFLVAFDDHLAVLTKKGTLHLGAASRESWSEMARLELFDDLAWTPPSVAGSSLYVRSLGAVARVDLVRAAAPVELPTVEIPRQLDGLVADLATAREAGEETAPLVDAFWRDAEPPLVADAPDDDPTGDPMAPREIVFLWRGEAEAPAVAGDMIGMRREEPMHRLEGTDLWWWATELDPRARVSYVFVVNDEPVLDPSHARQRASTVLGPDMNWQRDEGLTMSWVALPHYPGLSGLETIEIPVEVPGREEGEVVERNLEVTVWLPPGYSPRDASDDADARYPVVYVQDPAAADVGRWPATLDDVVGRSVEPLIVVFLSPLRGPAWPTVLADQVVPAIDERYRTRPGRDARATVGMGFAANAALNSVFARHETFGVLGVQSLYSLEQLLGMIRGALGEKDAESVPLRIYYEWGRWDLVSPHEEMNMREASRQVWDLLRERGWEPMGGEVWDATDWASWSRRTSVLLESLFPAEGDGPSPRLAKWTTAED